MSGCESRRDSYKVENDPTSPRGYRNVLVLNRCIYENGHDSAHIPPRHDAYGLPVADPSTCRPFCGHLHQDSSGNGWPTENEWQPADPNAADNWDAMSRIVSSFPHE